MSKYTIRRTENSTYRLERPDGTEIVRADATSVPPLPTDADTDPDIPADIAEPVISWAEANSALHDWRVMAWVGVRYVDDR